MDDGVGYRLVLAKKVSGEVASKRLERGTINDKSKGGIL